MPISAFILLLLLLPEQNGLATDPPLQMESPTEYLTKTHHLNYINPTKPNIKELPDLYFECYIAELGKKGRIPLFYDQSVRYYINLYFTERETQIIPILQKTVTYFPMFQNQLELNHLPPELKFLPILESALSPTAVSTSAAVGLWQFKKETGIHCGLRIDNEVDERKDPEASTRAACKYLNEMYSRFGDWHLALLAYQAGPGTIHRAIVSSGGKTDYFELYPYLPEVTKKYLPAYIAMIYIFTYYDTHLYGEYKNPFK